MRGPKRASKIRKLFNLSKEDDVRKYVNTYRRTFTTKSGQSLLILFLTCLVSCSSGLDLFVARTKWYIFFSLTLNYYVLLCMEYLASSFSPQIHWNLFKFHLYFSIYPFINNSLSFIIQDQCIRNAFRVLYYLAIIL